MIGKQVINVLGLRYYLLKTLLRRIQDKLKKLQQKEEVYEVLLVKKRKTELK